MAAFFITVYFRRIYRVRTYVTSAYIYTNTKGNGGKSSWYTANTGTLMGPLLGGVIADMFSYSAAFKGVSITLFLSALIVMFGVQEVQAKIISQGEQTSYSSKEVLQHIIGNPVLFIVMITSSLVQLAHFSVQPILSLYVK